MDVSIHGKKMYTNCLRKSASYKLYSTLLLFTFQGPPFSDLP